MSLTVDPMTDPVTDDGLRVAPGDAGAPPPEWHERVVTAALPAWPGGEGAHHELLCISENATYRIDFADGRRTVLRVNRPGYHSYEALVSEVAWVRALRADGVVRTADGVPTAAGEDVVALDLPGEGRRHAVMSEWVDGCEPSGESLADDYAQVGALTARMHRHARAWTPPAGFTRFAWSLADTIGDGARWGRWQDAPGVGPAETALLRPAARLVAERVSGFGDSPDRFGLIHADMRPANLLVRGGRGPGAGSHPGSADVHVIDFDDCGFGWYAFDLAAALSFLEAEPQAPELAAAWLEGYTREGTLDRASLGMIPSFVMLRRLMLLAWVGSHAETEMAASVTDGFAEGTCVLAQRFLASGGNAVW